MIASVELIKARQTFLDRLESARRELAQTARRAEEESREKDISALFDFCQPSLEDFASEGRAALDEFLQSLHKIRKEQELQKLKNAEEKEPQSEHDSGSSFVNEWSAS